MHGAELFKKLVHRNGEATFIATWDEVAFLELITLCAGVLSMATP
jgi:hypothetical protein